MVIDMQKPMSKTERPNWLKKELKRIFLVFSFMKSRVIKVKASGKGHSFSARSTRTGSISQQRRRSSLEASEQFSPSRRERKCLYRATLRT
jgi:hypothetical protein